MSLVRRIGIPMSDTRMSLRAVGGQTISPVHKTATLHIRTRAPTRDLEVPALILEDLGITTPQSGIRRENWSHLSDLDLADPDFCTSRKIDVLLGAEAYARILWEGIRKGSRGEPTAQNTCLGWIVFGAIETVIAGDNSPMVAMSQADDRTLEKILRRFWELEEFKDAPGSTDDQECERLFTKGHYRDANGRYIVRLPLREEPPTQHEEVLAAAHRSFRRTQRRMERDPEFAKNYRTFMKEYLDLCHMRPAPVSDASEGKLRQWYLPHHGVWQSADQTKKLRVVFDASYKTTAGVSLNSLVYTGPSLLVELIFVLLKWRFHRYAMAADIEKMYRMIGVDPRDIDLQRIIWEDTETGLTICYVLLTLTYGFACAPYLALRVLRQLIIDEGYRFPKAAEVLEECRYMDDIYFGADDVDSARRLQQDLIALLGAGCFPLKKWVASDPSLTDHLKAEERLRPDWKDFGADRLVKTLGIAWDPQEDAFRFTLCAPLDPSPATKRTVLSAIARIFDPMGWLSPILIRPKILMQDMWKCKVSWDEELPSNLACRWREFTENVAAIRELRLPRWVGLTARDRVELHGFADASQAAYAAVIYLKRAGVNDHEKPWLLIARTKVAPVKTQTIPRLELCATALLAKLLRRLVDGLGERVLKIFAWSDSRVALAWIASEAARWPVFVANRVAQVRRLIPSATWNYVPSRDNPADLASRGIRPDQFGAESSWWNGPDWLALSSREWPKRVQCCLTQEELEVDVERGPAPEDRDELITRFSSLEKLLRVIARCLRVNQRHRRDAALLRDSPLTATEFSRAFSACVRYVQHNHFKGEIDAIGRGRSVPRNSPLLSLNPFLDDKGVVRVGGRLHHSSLPYNQRHPVILPKGCHLAQLVIDRAHRAAMHGGNALTYSYAIRNTWIVGGRGMVRAFIRNCVVCARSRAVPSRQMMGDLPGARITPGRPFSRTGVDYAGPFHLKSARGRGIRTSKGYLAVFVCMSTKAVHLEVVGDLTTATFLAAIERFISRRGTPSEMWSDNATTFHGADAELRAMLREAEVEWSQIPFAVAPKGIEWRFIPPSAPHFGGLWEAAVKSAKSHLKRTIGQRNLTYEEMATLMAQVELVMNSRPLTPLSGNPEDGFALTPNHLLHGFALNDIPQPMDATHEDLDKNSHWQLVRGIRNHFWARWSREYLNTLQQRSKWQVPRDNLRPGDIVLIMDSSLLKAGRWPLGRITDVHPGKDGLVRVATIRTQQGEYRRPFTKIIKLPVDN